jgi:hypothetical protein
MAFLQKHLCKKPDNLFQMYMIITMLTIKRRCFKDGRNETKILSNFLDHCSKLLV